MLPRPTWLHLPGCLVLGLLPRDNYSWFQWAFPSRSGIPGKWKELLSKLLTNIMKRRGLILHFILLLFCMSLALPVCYVKSMCVCVNCSVVSNSVTSWTVAFQAPLLGISQAKILEWVSIPFPRGSFSHRDWTQVSCTASRFFTIWATWEWLKLENTLKYCNIFLLNSLNFFNLINIHF